mmetsp:Transcript_12952/g.36694  ORF Transcript_12952/g.36694 Transcript_12952/m.36694 type:complete len:727 (-) Transcript_12952:3060-5240(-)
MASKGEKGVQVFYPTSDPMFFVAAILASAGEKSKEVKLVGMGPKNTPVVEVRPNGLTGDVLYGCTGVGKYLCHVLDQPTLLGAAGYETAAVDQWLHYLEVRGGADDDLLGNLNVHLSLRTVLVGTSVTLADLLAWAVLTVANVGAGWPHVRRYMAYLEAQEFARGARIQAEQLSELNRPKERGHAFLKLKGDPKEGQVVTRFPPEPSGYMHIGHLKAAILNDHYARQYKGKLVVRMDDTNPTKEKEEYAEAILSDLKRVGVKGDVFTHTSDHFDFILAKCEELIRDGVFYVDGTPGDEIKEQRMNRQPSAFRDQSAEESLRLWELMKQGDPKGTSYVVRAKIDYSSPVGCMRDPNMFRCVPDADHPRVGRKYKVFPLYDFACPIVDSREGVTHALRTNEYHDRNALYDWVLDVTKMQHRPIIEDYSRLNFQYTVLSKRKLQWFVDQGYVEGWDDPCFPTVSGLLRRGLTVEAMRAFIVAQGSSKNSNLMDPVRLWSMNKAIIDPRVPRYSAIFSENRVPLTIAGAEPSTVEVPLHRKNPKVGNKTVYQQPRILIDQADAAVVNAGETITLLNWGSVAVTDVTASEDGTISAISATLSDADPRSNKNKFNWVPDRDDMVPITTIECENLITKPKVAPPDTFEDLVPATLKYEMAAVGEPAMGVLKKGDQIQLERRGYFICDKVGPDGRLFLVQTPDGLATGMSVRGKLVGVGRGGASSNKQKKAEQK